MTDLQSTKDHTAAAIVLLNLFAIRPFRPGKDVGHAVCSALGAIGAPEFAAAVDRGRVEISSAAYD